MKTKDLMMGDWIQSPITPKPLKVAQINWDYSVECVGIDDMIRYHVGLGDIEPILITPEILEKNGFISQGMDLFTFYVNNVKCSSITIRFRDDTCYLNYYETDETKIIEFLKLKYVHQLQHFLRLCGIEKEIQL